MHVLKVKNIESTIRNQIIYLLPELKGFKFVMTLVLGLKKIESDDETKYSNFIIPKAKAIINESDNDVVFE